MEKAWFAGGQVLEDGALKKNGLMLKKDGTLESEFNPVREVTLVESIDEVQDEKSNLKIKKPGKELGKAKVYYGPEPNFLTPKAVVVDGVCYTKWSDDFYVKLDQNNK